MRLSWSPWPWVMSIVVRFSPVASIHRTICLAAGGLVAAGPPGGDQRRVLVGCVLPGEVPGVEDVELAVVSAAEPVEIWRLHPVVQPRAQLERDRRAAAFLLGVIVIVGGLIYFPMLILGSIKERIIG
jgi:hypothetical protein